MPLIVVVDGIDDTAKPTHAQRRAQGTIFQDQLPGATVHAFSFFNRHSSKIRAGHLRSRANTLLSYLQGLDLPASQRIFFVAHNTGAAIVKQLLLIASENQRFNWVALQTCALYLIESWCLTDRREWEELLFRLFPAGRLPAASLADLAHVLPDELARTEMLFSAISPSFIINYRNKDGIQLFEPKDSPWYFDDHGSRLVELLDDMQALNRQPNPRYTKWFARFYHFLGMPEACSGRLNAQVVDASSIAWLENNSFYKRWHRYTGSSMLVLTGPPGLGKRRLSAHLLHSLCSQAKEPNAAFLSFSFDRWDVTRNTEWSLVTSLIRQLLMLRPGSFDSIETRARHILQSGAATLALLWDLFTSLLVAPNLSTASAEPKVPPVYIFVNAVDMCHTHFEKAPVEGVPVEKLPVEKVLASLVSAPLQSKSSREPPVKIFVTVSGSSSLKETRSIRCMSLESTKWREGMREVTTKHVRRLVSLRPVWEDKQEAIVENLLRGEPSYLFVMLNLKSLEQTSIPSTRSALQEKLMGPSLSLQLLFQSLVQHAEASKLATLALQWIYQAVRPLTPSELSAAMALSEIGPESYQSEYKGQLDIRAFNEVISWDIMRDLSSEIGSAVKEVNDRVLLVHHTFRQHLAKSGIIQEPEFHGHIAMLCILYIDMYSSSAGTVSAIAHHGEGAFTADGISSKDLLRSLLPYAELYWADHYRLAETSGASALDDSVLRFLERSTSPFTSTATFSGKQKTKARPSSVLSLQTEKVEKTAEAESDSEDENASENHDGDESSAGEDGMSDSSSVFGIDGIVAAMKGWLATCIEAFRWPHRVQRDPLSLAIILRLDRLVQRLLRDLPYQSTEDLKQVRRAAKVAAHIGNLGVLQQLVNKGLVDTALGPIICEAAAKGHVETVKQLLLDMKNTAELATWKTKTTSKRNPLLSAVENGHTDLVEILLENGFHMLACDNAKKTAVYLAAEIGDAKTLKVLERFQKDLFKEAVRQDTPGMNPLQVACRSGSVEAVQLIRDNISDRAILNRSSRGPYSPLQLCVMHGHLLIWERLVAAGADPLAGEPVEFPYESYVAWTQRRRWRDKNPTQLEIAARYNKAVLAVRLVKLFKAFLDKKKGCDEAEIQRTTDRIGAIFLSALFEAVSNGHVKIVKLLWNETKRDETLDRWFLHSAIGRGHLDVVKELAAADIPLMIPDAYNAHFDLAISEKRIDIVRFLIEHAGLTAQWDGNETSIHYTVRLGLIEVLRLLLKASKPDLVCRKSLWPGDSAIELAARQCSIACFRELWAWEKCHDIPGHSDKPSWALVKAIQSGESATSKIDFLSDLLHSGWDANGQDDDADVPLHVALLNNEPGVVRLLLTNGASPNKCDSGMNNALHIAVSRGLADYIPLLLEAEADPNAVNEERRTPFFIAAEEGSSEIMRLLLRLDQVDGAPQAVQTPDLNTAGPDDLRCIHLAATNLQAFNILLEGQAKTGQKLDVDAATQPDHHTALMIAVKDGPPEVVKMLLELKADPNAKDRNGDTALYHLVKRQDPLAPDIARLLKSYDADFNIKGGLFASPLCAALFEWKALEGNIPVEVSVDDPDTAVHGDVDTGEAVNERLYRVFLELGAKADIQDERFGTLFHVLFMASFELVQAAYEVAGALFKHNAPINGRDSAGRTPLLYLVSRGPYFPYWEMVMWLVSLGADPSIADNTGTTPLHTIASMSMYDDAVVEAFLQNGARWDAVDNTGRTVLYMAAMSSSLELFEHILRWVPKDALLAQKEAVLTAAIKSTNAYICDAVLYESGIGNVNIPDRNGWRPLDIARGFGFKRTAHRLLNMSCTPGPNKKQPTRMSQHDVCSDLFVSDDGLGVGIKERPYAHYNPLNIAGSVRADYCINPDLGSFYMEVTIAKMAPGAAVAIGIIQESTGLHNMVGWRLNTWGYHSDDGAMLYCLIQQDSEEVFVDKAQTCEEGDVLGMGYDPASHRLWFTRAGTVVAMYPWAGNTANSHCAGSKQAEEPEKRQSEQETAQDADSEGEQEEEPEEEPEEGSVEEDSEQEAELETADEKSEQEALQETADEESKQEAAHEAGETDAEDKPTSDDSGKAVKKVRFVAPVDDAGAENDGDSSEDDGQTDTAFFGQPYPTVSLFQKGKEAVYAQVNFGPGPNGTGRPFAYPPQGVPESVDESPVEKKPQVEEKKDLLDDQQSYHEEEYS